MPKNLTRKWQSRTDDLSTKQNNSCPPPTFWADALHATAYLHNITPTKLLHFQTPTSILFRRNPSYDHLRVFGCACYPNLFPTHDHKLSPRSVHCVFLGCPTNYQGYRCLDPTTSKIHLSRHVTFDENVFPFATSTSNLPNDYRFIFSDKNLPSTIHHFISPPTSPTSPTPSSPTPSSLSAHPTSHPSGSSSSQFPSPPPLVPTHLMTTRSHLGTFKPIQRINLHTSSISPIPKNPHLALLDPNWKQTMNDEYKELCDNET